MVLGIKYNKMYEDLAFYIREEMVECFTNNNWGKYESGIPDTWDEYPWPQHLAGTLSKDQFQFSISEDDLFEMFIVSVVNPNADPYYLEFQPTNPTVNIKREYISVWSKEKTGRIPTIKDIMDYFIMLADFEEGLYIRRRVVVEGADIRDADDPGVEHLI